MPSDDDDDDDDDDEELCFKMKSAVCLAGNSVSHR